MNQKVQCSKDKTIHGIREIEDMKDFYNDAEIQKTESA